MSVSLFEGQIETSRPARPVYCHQDFLDGLAERRNEPVGKRSERPATLSRRSPIWRAAKIYLDRGDRERALKCYRPAAEFQAALELVKGMEGHAAKASLEWVEELNDLLARRPQNFSHVLVPQEKVRLEGCWSRRSGFSGRNPRRGRRLVQERRAHNGRPLRRGRRRR